MEQSINLIVFWSLIFNALAVSTTPAMESLYKCLSAWCCCCNNCSTCWDDGEEKHPYATFREGSIPQINYLANHPNLEDVNEKDEEGGNTALHYAVNTNDIKRVEALLNAGASVRIPNNAGQTVRHLVHKKRSSMAIILDAAYLKEIGAENYGLFQAARKNKTHVLVHIIKTNRQAIDLDAQDNDGNTALHYAAQHNNIHATEFLINKGASKNITNKDGKTAEQLVPCECRKKGLIFKEPYGHACVLYILLDKIPPTNSEEKKQTT